MNTPKLRFKEFSGEWEVKKLGDVSESIMYGMNASAITYDGTNKYIRITDIDEESRTFKPSPLSSPSGEIEDKFKLKKGDLLFTRTGASVGKSYLYKEEDGNLLFAGFLIKFSITKANPYFVFSKTLTECYNSWIAVMSMRSGQPGVNAEEFKEFKFKFPTLPEQTKIANFLTAIDEKIAQLSQTAQLLTDYKKGVMQQIFSQQLRFKDEKSELRTGKLKDFGYFYYGKSVPKDSVTDEAKTPCVRYGELYSKYNGHIKKIKSYTNIPVENLKFSKGGEILIPRVGENPLDFANCSYLPFADVAIGEMISVFNTKENGLFLTYYINAMLKKQFARYVEGGSVANLYFRYLENIEITIPSLPEQTKIANFLTAIDDKINHNQTQLDAMKQYKSGLLQQMFV